jgi:NAD(P)-dependent dehydrogenase (short-subunit alcohol dehydrogenase family)
MTFQKVAIVTGSSSGIGRETSLLLARNGFKTYATMRNLSKRSAIEPVAAKEGLPIHVVELDVTSDKSVHNAIQQIVSDGGRIDVLVNNAGYALSGALEDLSMEEIKAQYETNVFGLIRVTNSVLPTMRRQGSGIIVNLSSGAGVIGYPGSSAYVSTKFAVEGLTESMAYEMEPFGLRTIIIEPGLIRTNFANAMKIAKKAQEPNSPYSHMMKNMSKMAERLSENASPPELVAKVILDAIATETPRLRNAAGKDIEGW